MPVLGSANTMLGERVDSDPVHENVRQQQQSAGAEDQWFSLCTMGVALSRV